MAKIKITYNDGSFAEWEVDSTLAAKTHQSLPMENRVGQEDEIDEYGQRNRIGQYSQIDRRPTPVVNKNDLAYLFQDKRESLLNEVEEFKNCVALGTLGDYSEIGFLANLLQILMED